MAATPVSRALEEAQEYRGKARAALGGVSVPAEQKVKKISTNADEARELLADMSITMRVLTGDGHRIASCGSCAKLMLETDAHHALDMSGTKVMRLCGPCSERRDREMPVNSYHSRAQCPGCDAERREPGFWATRYGYREAVK